MRAYGARIVLGHAEVVAGVVTQAICVTSLREDGVEIWLGVHRIGIYPDRGR